jgi:hypothetical protein
MRANAAQINDVGGVRGAQGRQIRGFFGHDWGILPVPGGALKRGGVRSESKTLKSKAFSSIRG